MVPDMPPPIMYVARTVNFPREVWQDIEDYRKENDIRSWSQALMMIVGRWQADRQRRRGQI